jgi:hypothetical protein
VGWLAATALSIALGWIALLPVMHTAAPGGSTLLAVEQLPRSERLPSTAPTSTASPSPEPRPTTRKPTTEPTESPATVDGWAVSAAADGTKSYLRSFRVAGGQAVIRMAAGEVELVSATPSPDYTVASVQNKPEDLAVFFTRPNHGFTIHAIWWNDRPYAEVTGR